MSKIIVPKIYHPQLQENIAKWLLAHRGPDPEYSPAEDDSIEQYGLPLFRVAALVVGADDKTILCQEGRIHIDKVKDPSYREYLIKEQKLDAGGWTDGEGGWNIPAGRLRPGETFEDGLTREIREESGHEAAIQGILCVRWSKKFVMPIYLAKDLSGPDHYHTEETREILDTNRFSVEGVRTLDSIGMLRSPKSVLAGLDAYEAYLCGERKLGDIEPYSGKDV